MTSATRGSDGVAARHVATTRIAAIAALLLGTVLVAQRGDAQSPRTPRDTVRAPGRDTTRRAPVDSLPGTRNPAIPTQPPLDTLPIDSPRRDGRQAAADSTARDSLIARQLREARRTGAISRLLPVLDRLTLTGIGASAGGAWPRRVDGTSLVSVHADYGAAHPAFDVLFTVSYWRSNYVLGARQEFARQVAAYAGRPPGDTLPTPSIRASAFSFAVDGRFRPAMLGLDRWRARRLQPFVSGGLALHFPNAEGAPITGTFVEQSLDGLALGVAGGAGLDLVVLPNLQLTMLARYDLFNGTHYASLRAGASYLFERWRPRAARPAAGARAARGGA